MDSILLGSEVLAHNVKVVLSIVSSGVPLITPVVTLKVRPIGKSGDTAQMAPGTELAGSSGTISVLLTSTVGPSGPVPSGLESGPARQIGNTEFGPSQIPSPSVSGFSESVPISLPSMKIPVPVSASSDAPSLSSSRSSIRS